MPPRTDTHPQFGECECCLGEGRRRATRPEGAAEVTLCGGQPGGAGRMLQPHHRMHHVGQLRAIEAGHPVCVWRGGGRGGEGGACLISRIITCIMLASSGPLKRGIILRV